MLAQWWISFLCEEAGRVGVHRHLNELTTWDGVLLIDGAMPEYQNTVNSARQLCGLRTSGSWTSFAVGIPAPMPLALMKMDKWLSKKTRSGDWRRQNKHPSEVRGLGKR